MGYVTSQSNQKVDWKVLIHICAREINMKIKNGEQKQKRGGERSKQTESHSSQQCLESHAPIRESRLRHTALLSRIVGSGEIPSSAPTR